MDMTNRFGIGTRGDGCVSASAMHMPLSKDDVLNLAAWLVVTAGVSRAEFEAARAEVEHLTVQDLLFRHKNVAMIAVAKETVQAIEDDLTDRNGLRQAWEEIDDDIREEILVTWREKVTAILARADRKDGGSR